MAEWLVELEGHRFDLLDLAEHLGSLEISVRQEGEAFFLRAAILQSCSDSSEVYHQTKDLISVLNGAAAAFSEGYRPVSIRAAVHVDDRENRQHFIFMPPVEMEGRSRMSMKIEGGTPGPPIVEGWLTIAVHDPAVARALHLYGSLPHNWRNLYLILDSIAEDMGGLKHVLTANWAPRMDIELFRWTANEFSVTGAEARHGREQFNRPSPDPSRNMSLKEAQNVMFLVLRGWLTSKSDKAVDQT